MAAHPLDNLAAAARPARPLQESDGGFATSARKHERPLFGPRLFGPRHLSRALPKGNSLFVLAFVSASVFTFSLLAQPEGKPRYQQDGLVARGDARQTLDAKNWGEDIKNPFAGLAPEIKSTLEKKGVNVKRLEKLNARYITGTYCGVDSKLFVNKDPDTVLVFGHDFSTQGDVVSFGPILAYDQANFGGVVIGKDLVWLVEDVPISQRSFSGKPLIIDQKEPKPFWRRPERLVSPLVELPEKERARLADHLRAKRGELQKGVNEFSGVSVRKYTEPTTNPFTRLSEAGIRKLQVRGLDPKALAKLDARLLTGEYYGADSRDFLNDDPGLVLVVGEDFGTPGFGTHGTIYSLGPVVATGRAQLGNVVGADVVWFADESVPRGKVAGAPVIFSPAADYRQFQPMVEDVWHGDYGLAVVPGGPVSKARYRQDGLVARGDDSETLNAKNWGEDINNPFARLAPEVRSKLETKGVNVKRLEKLGARYITGKYCGANMKCFVNKDPDTILVFGDHFWTHGDIVSFGPILACDQARFQGVVLGKGLVWLVEDVPVSARPWYSGKPLIVDQKEPSPFWRRPERLVCPLLQIPEKERARLADNLNATRADLRKKVNEFLGISVRKYTKPTTNPFTSLSENGIRKLEVRGLDPKALARLNARILTGTYYGADSRHFVNDDPRLVLVVGEDFRTHGDIYSLGPVVATGRAHFMGDIVGADVVWFADTSFPRGQVSGAPVIFSPTAKYSQFRPMVDDIWHGDYGLAPTKPASGKAKAGSP